jgi:hypothetical protein
MAFFKFTRGATIVVFIIMAFLFLFPVSLYLQEQAPGPLRAVNLIFVFLDVIVMGNVIYYQTLGHREVSLFLRVANTIVDYGLISIMNPGLSFEHIETGDRYVSAIKRRGRHTSFQLVAISQKEFELIKLGGGEYVLTSVEVYDPSSHFAYVSRNYAQANCCFNSGQLTVQVSRQFTRSWIDRVVASTIWGNLSLNFIELQKFNATLDRLARVTV